MQLLATLLTEHGVPTQAHERAQQAISKLGLSAVQLARAAPPPWTELKARASTPATMFRLVLPKHVPRASSGQPSPQTRKSSREKVKGALVSRRAPLPCHAIAVDARGIAICTAQQAMPFIKAAKRISTEAINEPRQG